MNWYRNSFLEQFAAKSLSFLYICENEWREFRLRPNFGISLASFSELERKNEGSRMNSINLSPFHFKSLISFSLILTSSAAAAASFFIRCRKLDWYRNPIFSNSSNQTSFLGCLICCFLLCLNRAELNERWIPLQKKWNSVSFHFPSQPREKKRVMNEGGERDELLMKLIK